MNKVITINLHGNAYQLEEAGFEALRNYLDRAARQLETNPDKDEIMADIEQAIAEKCRAILGPNKTVVVGREIEKIVEEMGPVEDASVPRDDPAPGGAGARPTAEPDGAAGPKVAGATGTPPGAAKRLYKIRDGAMIAGVCNGLAAYFNIDVTIVRILFVLLTLTYGTGLLLYFLMVIIVPTAGTPAERAAAYGIPATAQEFIRRAREGYYDGMKTFADRQSRREWRRKFKQDMRGWKRSFQREMSENAHQWQGNWQQWAQYPPHWTWPVFGAPFLGLLSAVILVLGIYAIFSLVSHGAVFGLVLPASVPLWVGILFLIVACQILRWPLKVLRHPFLYRGGCGPGQAGPLISLWDSLVWLGFLVLLVWLADRYVPQAHEALQNLPPVLHHAIDSVQQWWDKR